MAFRCGHTRKRRRPTHEKRKKTLLFWPPLIGLAAAGVALWPTVFKARFPEGRGLYFVLGPLWGWMGLVQLLGFIPQGEDRPPEAPPGRLASGLAMLGLCALYLGDIFLPAFWPSVRSPRMILEGLFLTATVVVACLSNRKKYREE